MRNAALALATIMLCLIPARIALAQELGDHPFRDPKLHEALERAAEDLKSAGPDDFELLGALFRDTVAGQWPEVARMRDARDEAEFRTAASGLARLFLFRQSMTSTARKEQREGGRDLSTAIYAHSLGTPVRVGALIASEHDFVPYRVGDAVQAFAALVDSDRRAPAGLGRTRQYEFRDGLLLALMFQEAMRDASGDEEALLREAFVSASYLFIRQARGILSWTRLPLSRVIDLVSPLIEDRAEFREALDRAVANPFEDGFVRTSFIRDFRLRIWLDFRSARARFDRLTGCGALLVARPR